MKLLPACPDTVHDAEGAPRFGTYRGGLATLSLEGLRGRFQPGRIGRFRAHKKWQYAFVATREVAVLYAVVDVNYTSNAFVMAVDLGTKAVLADESFLGPPRPLVRVSDQPNIGLDISFRRPGADFTAARTEGDARVHLRARVGRPLPLLRPTLALDAALLTARASPPLTVIAPVDGGIVNVTQKWAGLLAFGQLEVNGRRYVLDGGVGGLDSTQGYLARQTDWRWAFACGRLRDGTPIGINLVEGFNETRDDVNENAVWLGDALHPVGRARFVWHRDDVLQRWHVTTTDGALDLSFSPIAVHREHRDLKVVVRRFAQPVGLWSGKLTLDGVTHELHDVPGVTEDQHVRW
jgi:hypothetical protein